MSRARSLRLRLVSIVVALLAAVAAVIGLVAVAVLQSSLMSRLDESVASAAQRSVRALGPDWDPSGKSPDGDDYVDVRGQGEGTLVALVSSGAVVTAAYIDKGGSIVHLPASAQHAILDIVVDGRPHTVDLGGDLGQYRMVAQLDTYHRAALVTGLPLTGVQATVGQLGLVVALVSLGGVAVAGGIAALTVGAALRPLHRVATTAASVAELPLDRDVDIGVRVPEADTDPSTEVGRVGAALNRLLGHVGSALAVRKASEDKVRRFVGDASHELRTPLASIRGYAELTRRTSPDLPEDVRHSLSRIESEAIRMTSLVEDLLLLARLDSKRELEREEVDLSRILVEAVGDAHAAGPDHDWRIDAPDEPVTVIGDEARLRQIVVNLLANARVHTPPGTTVTASVAAHGDTVAIRVADTGPGIPPEQLPGLFERFTRGDASRARATGSTGLGLSIVKGVAEAHGGTVSVASRPGETAFTVTLPVIPPEPEPEAAEPRAEEDAEREGAATEAQV